MALILASQSPRRRELLNYITENFTVKVSQADESVDPTMSPRETVEYLARLKGEAVYSVYPEDTVLSADTVVVLGNEILGKPRSYKDAYSMLSLLSGKTHEVYTGVCIISQDRKICFSQCTEVTFYELSDEDIRKYIDTNEPFDKAGGYGIQGKGSVLIKGIVGDYYNVMGLPVAKLARVMKENGVI